MASLVSVRPRKQINYKKLNEGEPLPSASKVRVSRVYSETFSVERIIARKQSEGVSSIFISILYSHVARIHIINMQNCRSDIFCSLTSQSTAMTMSQPR